jgi:hypothetical protein
MRIVFSGTTEIHDAFGRLHYGANALQYVGVPRGLPPMRIRGVVPQGDGSYYIYGCTGGPDRPWRLLRARTFDGLQYEATEVVHESEPGRWLGEHDVVHNPETGQLLCLHWSRGDIGHALWGFASEDGRTWRPLADRPLYHDHDAFGTMWHPSLKRYVIYQATYQPWQKPYPDNLGDGIRRVLHIRTSEDGAHWEPSADVGMHGPYAASGQMITPDDADPPEAEFYRFKAFAYGEGFAGMMLVYAPSPQVANVRFPFSMHGMHLTGEWWISHDGMAWQRPYRDVHAPGAAGFTIDHAPITAHGWHLWVVQDASGLRAYGVPENRLFFVGSLANAGFSTPALTLSGERITLNAALGFHGQPRAGIFGGAYVMAELRKEDGEALAGYEKEHCVFFHLDDPVTALHWGERTGQELAGQRVRLRLYLRDARIYAVEA